MIVTHLHASTNRNDSYKRGKYFTFMLFTSYLLWYLNFSRVWYHPRVTKKKKKFFMNFLWNLVYIPFRSGILVFWTQGQGQVGQ